MKIQQVHKKSVAQDDAGMRLDNYLISNLKGVPKSKIYSIIRKGEVRVNSKRYKPRQRIEEGDIVRIPPVEIKTGEAPKPRRQLIDLIKESFLFEDKSLLVIDKPIGIASHGGSGISLGLIEIVRQIDSTYKNIQLVHRLDKETSGCIVLAKKKSILREMHRLLRDHKVEKNYIAITQGKWEKKKIKVNLNLQKTIDSSGEKSIKVSYGGQNSLSTFEQITYNKGFSLVDCLLETGRTHQIRVHCNYLGHPIAGDKKYGDKEFNKRLIELGYRRMMLHASSIHFRDIGFSVKSKIPDEFNLLLDNI